MRTQSLFLALILFTIATAQISDKQIFNEGVNFYNNGNYSSAEASFIKILKTFPNSDIITSTKLMLGKVYFQKNDYRAATIVCDNFLQTHPVSAYVDDIHFLKGQIEFKKGMFQNAIESWEWVSERGLDRRLVTKSRENIFKTLSFEIPDNELDDLKLNSPDAKGLIKLVKIHKFLLANGVEAAKPQLQQFIRENQQNNYLPFATELLEDKRSHAGSNRVVFIKSNSPETKDVVNAIAAGLYYSLDEMENRNANFPLELDTISIGPSVLSAIKTVNRDLNQHNTLGYISALNNDINAAISLYSKYETFPYIIPTSSESGLNGICPNVFQLNPDAEMKGKALANYATTEMNLKTFAILAPANNYGEEIARSFEASVLEHDGEVAEIQWYYEDTEDFSRQLNAIRKKGFYITFRDSLLAEDSTLTEETLKTRFAEYKTETLFSNENVHGKVDSTQVPSTGIDGLFIVIYPDLIPYIAPQFASHNIQTTLLGNEGWNDRQQLELQRIYLDGLIYTNAGYLDKTSWNYSEFTSRFRQKMNTTPEFYELLGYDVGKWFFQQYQPGMSRQAFIDALKNSPKYEGILINVNFQNQARVNNELNIIRFYSGRFFKLK